MSERERRQGLNEAVFRQVNERINDVHEAFELDPQKLHLMCECGDPACAERLEVPLEEYEDVRSDATTFLLNPEHIEPDVEKIVRERAGYSIVRKVDEAVARVVRRLNPRPRPA